jgi:hypothetical protein
MERFPAVVSETRRGFPLQRDGESAVVTGLYFLGVDATIVVQKIATS